MAETENVKIISSTLKRLKQHCVAEYGDYNGKLYSLISKAVDEWLDKQETFISLNLESRR